MADNGFNQVRVTEIVGIEFDVDDNGIEETIMRFLIRSRTADQLAVEFPFSMWPEIQGAVNDASAKFPGGRRAQ